MRESSRDKKQTMVKHQFNDLVMIKVMYRLGAKRVFETIFIKYSVQSKGMTVILCKFAFTTQSLEEI